MSKKETNKNTDNLERKNPFRTPEGYFENFSTRVMDRIEEHNKISSIQMFTRIIRPALAIAASFAIIFLLIYVPVNILRPQITMNIEEADSFELFKYYNINDQTMINIFEEEHNDTYDEELLETVLLASVSDIELLENKN